MMLETEIETIHKELTEIKTEIKNINSAINLILDRKKPFLKGLTARQTEVYNLMKKGYNNKEISKELQLDEGYSCRISQHIRKKGYLN